MNSKTYLQFATYAATDPRTGERRYRPRLVRNKSQKIGLSEIVASGLANKRIRGEQDEVEGVAKALLKEVADHVAKGYVVVLDDKIRVRLVLTGEMEGGQKTLTSRNTLRAVATTMSGLKVDRDDYSFTNVTDTSKAFYISDVSTPGLSDEKAIAKGSPIRITGRRLPEKENLSVRLAWLGEDEEEMGITPSVASTSDTRLIEIPWPSTLDAVAVGTPITVTVVRKDDSGEIVDEKSRIVTLKPALA